MNKMMRYVRVKTGMWLSHEMSAKLIKRTYEDAIAGVERSCITPEILRDYKWNSISSNVKTPAEKQYITDNW